MILPPRALFFSILLGVSSPGLAQTAQTTNPPARFELPTVIVTVEKRPQDVLNVPVSVTTVQRETLFNAGVRYVSDAGQNLSTFFSPAIAPPRSCGGGGGLHARVAAVLRERPRDAAGHDLWHGPKGSGRAARARA